MIIRSQLLTSKIMYPNVSRRFLKLTQSYNIKNKLKAIEMIMLSPSFDIRDRARVLGQSMKKVMKS